MLELGPLAFASPWILSALILLPLLWWLLRVTPPAPRNIRFPAIRLLFGLESPEKTPASSPWWLILLRLAAVTLLILGLAHPLLNPNAQLTGSGPVLIAVDDGWAAAANWSARQSTMRQVITQAKREDRGVIILTTAPTGDARAALVSGVLKPNDARGRVDALRPKPWPSDRRAAAVALEKLKSTGNATVLWLSDSLSHADSAPFIDTLRNYGSVRVLRENDTDLPRLVLPADETGAALSVTVRRAVSGALATAKIRALAEDGRVLGTSGAVFDADALETTATFDFPNEVRNEVARLDLDGEASAGAVVLLDERWRRRPVGLISEKPLDSDPSLLSESFYLDRALRPYSDVRYGDIPTLLRAGRAVIIVPDEVAINPADRGALTEWVENGGLLLRFAGPRIARDVTDDLTPVRLRRGGRALGGALLWSKPARLAGFSGESPFSGLEIPKDVTISRQVLAEPSLDLTDKTWARLTDGTPLVTTERRGKGRIVLIHTTANTNWTNLPLSGLFVEMLRRVIAVSRGVTTDTTGDRPLPPIETLNGFGRAAKPGPSATAITSSAFADAVIGPQHPPGYYGTGDTRRALNLAPRVTDFSAMASLPAGVSVEPYAESDETDVKPWLLLLALLLFLADVIATLALRGLLVDALLARKLRPASVRGATLGAATVLILLAMPSDLSAQQSSIADRFALEASQATRLAYVITGANDVDSVSRAGLTGLSNVLNQRTAVETGAPIGVNLDTDELAFFSLVYWPITADQRALPEETVGKLNRFMETGGTILIDTRDRNLSSGATSPLLQSLRRLTRGLNLPPIEPIPPTHVLTKAFYLMQAFPGRWTGGQVWVERGDSRTNDGVSRVITGGHDWAAAWAIDNAGRPMFPVVPGGERQREMAYRFGVNLVMYTLTGNYKSDQVHVPAILERLGQ
jgi:Domain of unknown function (DUF4159)/Aerotolerance regulator N-terminal